MAVCSNCGAELQDGVNYCSGCGEPVADRGVPGERSRSSGQQRPSWDGNDPPAEGQSQQAHAGSGQDRRAAGQPRQGESDGYGDRRQPGNRQPTATGAGHASPGAGQGYRDARIGRAPTGIRVLCAVFGLLGVFSLFTGAIAGDASQAATALGARGTGSTLGGLGVLLVLIGIGDFAAVYGLWNLDWWGWLLAVALVAFSLLVNVAQLAGTGGGIVLISIVVHLAIAGYLYRERALFDVEAFLPVAMQ
ncbi:zinc ribbon domain-containing protein [Halorhabdus sp. BNX81]|uniref:zinc ribbon domain-containing protein n=1 Tax=Halorhabdus sp. BNX81 TaxID=2980181 RepID=UPI0023DD3871|nr:zinc ribbon domain-containing protein [Halorhabdus sp. BNX81]